MDKLHFGFKMRGAADKKSTMLCLTSIATSGHVILFNRPEDYQPTTLNKKLTTSQVFAKIKKTLTKRNQLTKVWITLAEELSEVYLDKGKNL